MSQLTQTTLGPYELLAPLGVGGMAEVYRAHDPRLDREVAIKVLAPELARQPGFLERFRREARAAARLDHPHIMPVFDFGEEGQLAYVVMPLVEGGTLRDRLAQRGMCSLREAGAIIYQVALALHEAHQHGLVHRDVKPANILLAPGGRAILADFGIACAIADKHDMGLTQTGMGIGTPEYMSPEQARGEEVDRRADVYALGIVFFQMLTGRVPFGDDDGFTIAYRQVNEPAPAPRRLNPTIPSAVEDMILKALAKDPAERFQTAAEFAAALAAGASWLELPGLVAQFSGPHKAVPPRRPAPSTPRRAGGPPKRVALAPVEQSARAPAWQSWSAGVDNESLTVPVKPLPSAAADEFGATPARAAGHGYRGGRKRGAGLVVVLLFVALIGGAVGAFGVSHRQPAQQQQLAMSPPLPAPTQTLQPTQPPQPTATPVPTTVYLSQLFTLTQDDLLQGDVLSKQMSVPNADYARREGPQGTLYQEGTANQFGRAFGIGMLVQDQAGNERFVALVDRFATFAGSEQYYQYETSQLSQTTAAPVGEQGMAGLALSAGGQASYRLIFRDRNVVVTFASVPTATPLAFQSYFLQLAQKMAQRGERCQFTPNLMPVPGSPKDCKP